MNVGNWHEFPITDQYQLQAEAFGRATRAGKKLKWDIDDAIKNMKVLDAFFKAGKSGKWEKV